MFSFWSCDDGNIDVNEFDFDTIEMKVQDCNTQTVLSKINGNEALILQLSTNKDTLILKKGVVGFELIKNGSHTIIYRLFDNTPTTAYFCQAIPPSTPKVVSEWLGSGKLTATTVLEKEDDNDGIVEPSDLAETDENFDTDGDTIPNYIDLDDDGDGILTSVEGETEDTDGDGKPNYLDDDDDGDGTKTINESQTEDADNDTIVDYLDKDSTTSLAESNKKILNKYTETYYTEFTIINLLLTNTDGDSMKFPSYDFGNSTPQNKEITESIIP